MIRVSKWMAVLALVGGIGCGSSGGSTGSVQAALTDKPTDLTNLKSVLVTINSVRIHDDAEGTVDGGTVADAGAADAGAGDAGVADAGTANADAGTVADGGTAAADDGTTGDGWIELCDNTAGQTFDLMTLTNGKTAPLCGGRVLTVPAGHISQARLGVISAQLVFTDGTTQDLTVPSGSESGLKINVDETVPAGGTLEIKFDFVASDSIVAQGNGSYLLKPVIKIAQ